MKLDKFIENLFGCVADKEGVENIKKSISDNILHDYDTTQIELQYFDKDSNYEVDMSICSDNYNDGEVIFLDLRAK